MERILENFFPSDCRNFKTESFIRSTKGDNADAMFEMTAECPCLTNAGEKCNARIVVDVKGTMERKNK
jgi:hypothetical protein